MLIVAGDFSISFDSCAIGGGIVALKNSVCRFAGGGMCLQHAADVGQEAHVEHAIGLVEHEVLQAAELGVRRPEVIEQPARAWRR